MSIRAFYYWPAITIAASTIMTSLVSATPITLPFDAAYMVAAAGSTEPVSSFALGGPAPWLYVDLPDGALQSFSSSASSHWFVDGSPAERFSASDGVWGAQDKYWLSPSEDVWNANKSAGAWNVDASFALVQLVMIYGVGAPVVWAKGSTTVPLTITSASTVPGDFNNDGSVDAADYVILRSGLRGNNTKSDYDVWRTNFGQKIGRAGAVASAAVPEPAAVVLLILAVAGCGLRRRRAA